jgi:hypothetical protein
MSLKIDIESYLISIGYTKVVHPNFKDEFKFVKPIPNDDTVISTITVFDDGSVQMLCLYKDVINDKLSYWNESRFVYDTHILELNLEEFKVIERVLTRKK